MPVERTLLLWLGPVLELGVLAGLIARRRVRRVQSLPILLLSLLATAVVIGLWPSVNTWRFWTIKATVHALLFLAVGFEIAARVFARVPRAAAAARRSIAVVVVLTVAFLVAPPHGHPALTLVPRLLAGGAWLYLGVLVLRVLFVMPLDPLHRAVLVGFGPYMMFYALTWGRVNSRAGAEWAGVFNAAVFVVALMVLLVAAWRREAKPLASPETVRLLWPWS